VRGLEASKNTNTLPRASAPGFGLGCPKMKSEGTI
jgi:hypothetical protein